MTLYLELTPEDEARLREHAEQQGTPLEVCAVELLRKQLQSEPADAGFPEPLPPVVDEGGFFHEDRWQAVNERLNRLFADRPSIPAEALSREVLYRDQD